MVPGGRKALGGNATRRDDRDEEVAMTVPIVDTILCVECGGIAHLLTGFPPDDPPRPGDVLAYRCEDCMERLDIVLEDYEDAEPPGENW
jgi:hypothetical protein